MRAVVGLLSSSACAWASAGALSITFPTGDAVQLKSGTSAALDPSLRGTVVERLVQPFAYTGTVAPRICPQPPCPTRTGDVRGSVESMVIKDSTGRYDTYWRITVAADAFLPVQRFEVAGLPPGAFDIGWRTDLGGDMPPAYASASNATLGVYWVVPLDRPAIAPGHSTPWFFLRGNPTGYTWTPAAAVASDQDGAGESEISGRSPNLRVFIPR